MEDIIATLELAGLAPLGGGKVFLIYICKYLLNINRNQVKEVWAWARLVFLLLLTPLF